MTCKWKDFCKQGDTCVAHIGYDVSRCTAFKDKGVPSVPITNEKWLRSCTTEQLAEFLNLIIRVGPYENEPKDFWEHVYGRGGEHGAKSIVTWLKKPHTEKE